MVLWVDLVMIRYIPILLIFLLLPMASPNHPIYKTSATIILRGKPITEKQKKEAKFLEFLSRAPISFNDE